MQSPAPTLATTLCLLSFPLLACGGSDGEAAEEAQVMEEPVEQVTLGPVDGHDLPATDLERVAVGTVAPDFSLQTISGETFTLSALRGAKSVVLVFYRGHW